MIDPAYGAADLHIHTTYSDGAPSPAMVVTRAVQLGLSVIAITDHDRIDGAIEGSLCDPARCEVVIGEEVTTHQGHVLGLFLTRAVPPGLDVEQTIDEIHAQGGDEEPTSPAAGGDECSLPGAFALDPLPEHRGAWLANRQARRAQGAWARAQTGGSDSHILAAVGSVVTAFPGRTAVDLRAALESGTTRAERRNRSPLVGAQTLTRSVLRRLSGEADRERARRAYR